MKNVRIRSILNQMKLTMKMEDCLDMTQVEFPKQLQSIGDNDFDNWTSERLEEKKKKIHSFTLKTIESTSNIQRSQGNKSSKSEQKNNNDDTERKKKKMISPQIVLGFMRTRNNTAQPHHQKLKDLEIKRKTMTQRLNSTTTSNLNIKLKEWEEKYMESIEQKVENKSQNQFFRKHICQKCRINSVVGDQNHQNQNKSEERRKKKRNKNKFDDLKLQNIKSTFNRVQIAKIKPLNQHFDESQIHICPWEQFSPKRRSPYI